MDKDKEKNEKIEKATPIAKIHASINLYPAEVENPQDALEWDDQFLEDLMMERDDPSDEEEYASSESSDDEEIQSVLSSSVKTDTITNTQPLSEMMKARYSILTQQNKQRKKLQI